MKPEGTKAIEGEKETVKVKVISAFRDKYNRGVIFDVGQELDFDKERAENVVSRGLAEYSLPEA